LDKQNATAGIAGSPQRDWLPIMASYRHPDVRRSVLELLTTLLPFAGLWFLAWAALSVGYWLSLAICVPLAFLLVRVFLIQHDCGHGAFFARRGTNDWIGRVLGILTLTPYDVWRKAHATHHATSGNLDKRGTGDITTLTVEEYRALPAWRRLMYRLYRNPLVMFGIGPAYVFLIRQRLPLGSLTQGWGPWVSAMATNAAIAVIALLLIWIVGLKPFLMVQIPVVLLAGSIGVWMFYVQHQFEDTYWAGSPGWKLEDAALKGSSYYDLPGVLRWFTANIGIHHVHHLYSRIPYYRLPEVLRDYPELTGQRRITLLESFRCVRLRLWDERKGRLVSFREARRSERAGA